MESIVTLVAEDVEFDQETSRSLSIVLTSVLRPEITSTIYPCNPDDESLEDSIGNAIFVLIRSLIESSDSGSASGSDTRYSKLLSLLSDLSGQVSLFSYCILYYLEITGKSMDKGSYDPYKDLATSTDSDLPSFLLNDLKALQDDDTRLFFYLLPSIYRIFEPIVTSNPSFMYLTVSTIDSYQLQLLVCQIVTESIKMIKKDSIINLISKFLS